MSVCMYIHVLLENAPAYRAEIFTVHSNFSEKGFKGLTEALPLFGAELGPKNGEKTAEMEAGECVRTVSVENGWSNRLEIFTDYSAYFYKGLAL